MHSIAITIALRELPINEITHLTTSSISLRYSPSRRSAGNPIAIIFGNISTGIVKENKPIKLNN